MNLLYNKGGTEFNNNVTDFTNFVTIPGEIMQKSLGELKNKAGTTTCKMFLSSASARAESYRFHKHIEFEISLILKGRGVYDTKTGRYDIRPGDVFIFSTNEYHCITDIYADDGSGGMELINLHFHPSFVWNIGNDYLSTNYLKIFLNRNKDFTNLMDRNNSAIKTVADAILSIRDEFVNKDYDYDASIKTKIIQLMITIHRNFNITDEHSLLMPTQLYRRMENALNFMDQNYCSEISLSEIAQQAFMSRTYFCSVFKESVGLTPWNYINIKRVNRAIELLKSTDLTITDIATQCGFNNSTNFNKIFKQITGCTPRSFRP